MNRATKLIVILLACVVSSASAQRAVIIQMPNGTYLGVAYTPSGQVVLTNVTLIKIPDPTPPAPTTTGLVWVTTIVDGRRVSADQSSELIDLRDWLDKQDATKVRRLEFSPDAKNERNEPDPRVASWVARIPESDREKPYVFVTQARVTDGKQVILWQGPLSKAETLIEETKKRAKL
jgi:hypothetical protein